MLSVLALCCFRFRSVHKVNNCLSSCDAIICMKTSHKSTRYRLHNHNKPPHHRRRAYFMAHTVYLGWIDGMLVCVNRQLLKYFVKSLLISSFTFFHDHDVMTGNDRSRADSPHKMTVVRSLDVFIVVPWTINYSNSRVVGDCEGPWN